MKQKLLILLLIPFYLISGLFYGLIAHKLVREKEPWFTLLMLGGLATTIALIAGPGGIPAAYAAWTFAGTGMLHIVIRLFFGKGGAFEMFSLPHLLAILALLSWPMLARQAGKEPAHHAPSGPRAA